jgi:hypothetical protein
MDKNSSNPFLENRRANQKNLPVLLGSEAGPRIGRPMD